MKKLIDSVKKPRLYEPHTMKFWDDEHISKGMLEAHLSPDIDAASRNHSTIDKSVQFITQLAPITRYPNLCDLGCGPGLYTDRFQKSGYQVTGFDISKRSLDYAKSQNRNVNYKLKSYLELDEIEAYHVITLIYYDYAVLPLEDRQNLLERIYKALKKDGLFLLDVHTEHYVNQLNERKDWYDEENGFFSEKPYLCLEATFKYDDYVYVEQYTLIDESNQVEVIRCWNKGYSVDTLKHEISHVPFTYVSHFADFTGKVFDESSDTLMMVFKK